MHVAARRHTRPGIALAGAAVIAVSPIVPILPDVHLPDVHLPHLSAAQVELTALTNPLAQWQQVISTAIDNIGQLGGLVLDDQAPIIQQVIADQLANAAVLSAVAKHTLAAINTSAAALPAALQTASGQLAAGDVEGAVAGIVSSLLPLVLNLVDGFNGAYPVVSNGAQNMANLVAVVPKLVLPAILALSAPLVSLVNAGAATAQDVVDALGAGNIEGLANAIIDAPAVLTGAVLNGYGDSPLGLPSAGLLSPIGALGPLSAGTISGLLSLRDIIASAIKPLAPPPAVKALKAEQTSGAPVAELPSVQANSVTVSVPTATTGAEATKPTSGETGSTTGESASGSTADSNSADSTGKTDETADDATDIAKGDDTTKGTANGDDTTDTAKGDATKGDDAATGETDDSDATDSTPVKPHKPSRGRHHESQSIAHTTKPAGPKHGSAHSSSDSSSSSAAGSAAGSGSRSTGKSGK
jgi:hypothetical protein